MTRIDIRILHNQDELYHGVLVRPTELGRQRDGEPAPFHSMVTLRNVNVPEFELSPSQRSPSQPAMPLDAMRTFSRIQSVRRPA